MVQGGSEGSDSSRPSEDSEGLAAQNAKGADYSRIQSLGSDNLVQTFNNLSQFLWRRLPIIFPILSTASVRMWLILTHDFFGSPFA